MSESFSIERRKMMRFLGAKVVLTPAALKGTGMLAKAVELAEEHDWFLVRQFENEANADAHSRTTAPEILDAFADTKLDYWVSGFGTGGTLKGVSRVLKEKSPETKIMVCEPDNSQILGSGIPQDRLDDGTPKDSHPLFRPHLMQGWSPDFIPKLTEDVVSAKLIDRILPINGDESLRLSKALATDEGIFVGISAGATLAGAMMVRRTGRAGFEHPVHVAGHRRALPEYTVVRRRPGRHDQRRRRYRAFDAELSIRLAASAAPGCK